MKKQPYRERFFGTARGLDRNLLPFMGPAQLGAGHPEDPYTPPTDPRCPICGGPMALHLVQRSANPSRPTQFTCPPRSAWDPSATA
jgi:hypothetical protein